MALNPGNSGGPQQNQGSGGRLPIGRRLAQLRQAAGLTRHDLAPLVCYGRSTVANTETGRQRPDRTFWLRCDEVLAADGILVAAYDQAIAHERLQRREQAADGVASSGPMDADAARIASQQGERTAEGGDVGLSRRAVLNAFAGSVLASTGI